MTSEHNHFKDHNVGDVDLIKSIYELRGYELSDSAWLVLQSTAIGLSGNGDIAETLHGEILHDRYTSFITRADLALKHPVTGDNLEQTTSMHQSWLTQKKHSQTEVPEDMLSRTNPFFTEYLVDVLKLNSASAEAVLIYSEISHPGEISFLDMLTGVIHGVDYHADVLEIKDLVRKWWDSLSEDGLTDDQIVNMLTGNYETAPKGTLRIGDVLIELFNQDSEAEAELQELLLKIPTQFTSEKDKQDFLARISELRGRRKLLSSLTAKLPTE